MTKSEVVSRIQVIFGNFGMRSITTWICKPD